MKRRLLRSAVLALALAAVVAGQMQGSAVAVGLTGGSASPELNACAAERAPILEREKQYEAVRRSRLGAALGAGLKKGAAYFAGAMLGRYMPGLASQAPGGGFFTPGNLNEALKLQIPGVTTPAGVGGFAGGNLGGDDTRAIAAMAVVVAIASTVEAYVQLKQQQAGGDNILLGNSIDDDARRQIEVNRAIASEEAALAACRQRQVGDYQQRLAGASNDAGRHALGRSKASLQNAIQKDVDLTGGVVDQQASLAKTYTQGRAMSEGRSEADILGGQAPAYAAAASTTPLKLPPAAASGKGAAPTPAAAPPPAPTWSTARTTIVRSGAGPNFPRVMSLAKGATLKLKDATAQPSGWTAVVVGGNSGFIRATDLVSATPVQTGPRLAPPVNIREHNRAVLAARDQGPNRLKTLLTDVQARLRPVSRYG